MTGTETETETEPRDRVVPQTVIRDCHSRFRLRLRLCLKFMVLQLTPFVEYILSHIASASWTVGVAAPRLITITSTKIRD